MDHRMGAFQVGCSSHRLKDEQIRQSRWVSRADNELVPVSPLRPVHRLSLPTFRKRIRYRGFELVVELSDQKGR